YNCSAHPRRTFERHFAAELAGAGGNCRTPRAVGGTGPQMDDGPQPPARLVDGAFKGDPATGDDGDPLAQALGVSDDVGGEEDGDAVGGLASNKGLQLFLIDGVEAGKWLVENDQAGSVDDGAELLHGLGHSLAQ